jgi:hypothetical protein
MALPDLFESSRRQLDPTGVLSALGGAPPSGTTLAFTMQHQLETEWCWAAVSTSVSLFYLSGSSWTQCKVVEAELGEDSCCDDGRTKECNIPWYLQKALTRTGNLNAMSAGSLPYASVNAEIKHGRPLGCRIGWTLGGGHFVVIHGYINKHVGAATETWVEVADPWYGASSLPYNDFRTKYQNSGSWTHSYTTRP